MSSLKWLSLAVKSVIHLIPQSSSMLAATGFFGHFQPHFQRRRLQFQTHPRLYGCPMHCWYLDQVLGPLNSCTATRAFGFTMAELKALTSFWPIFLVAAQPR